jgi:hypothetical protein
MQELYQGLFCRREEDEDAPRVIFACAPERMIGGEVWQGWPHPASRGRSFHAQCIQSGAIDNKSIDQQYCPRMTRFWFKMLIVEDEAIKSGERCENASLLWQIISLFYSLTLSRFPAATVVPV